MFQSVGSRVDCPKLEERVLASWKKNNIFEKSVAARKGGPRFTLYDGPPTVNGSPAIHHALTSSFKDILPRYKAMKGFYTPRMGGWDTHGLPVELEIEKKLGFSGKAQIEEYGIAEFNAVCRESVSQYRKEFEDLIERIGYWVDLEHPYVALDNSYIESIWWALKQMWDKGLVYQGYKVTPHCPRCETSLSSHEVAQGYKDDVEDPSVYVKFKVDMSEESIKRLAKGFFDTTVPTYLLAWTTTPWTLPGNTALAVAPDAEYAVVEADNEYLILADALRERVGLGGNKVVEIVKGSYLVQAEYEPLYNPRDVPFNVMVFKRQSDSQVKLDVVLASERPSKWGYPIIAGDFVSMEEGTGIVHIAPAFGEVDFQAGEQNGLYFLQPVDTSGRMTIIVPNVAQDKNIGGLFVKKADPLIIDDLKSRNLLFGSETIRHTYPFCWRCEVPLLYYAKQTWYIRTTAVKDRLISGNEEINWYPEHIKYGRFGDWLQNNVDWAFSRERYWGTPLPVWQCQACGSYECIGGLDELKGKAGFSGLKEPLDLHRPYVDEVTFTCSKCRGKMERVPEVFDCWFDSGAMPFAQFHYPFENKTLLEDGRIPADYICEAIDQTRGWFYTLHAISTLLFERICFKNVICLGHILDAKGEKMSKRKGNVVWPWPVVNKYGADALRWYFYTSSPPGNVRRFSEEMVAEVVRSFLSTLWNVYSFFVTYANIDKFVPGSKPAPLPQSELDRWILSELNQLILDVDSALQKYDPRGGAWPIAAFVDNLSNWYVRRSRRRFWKSENDADKLSAYNTLYECLVTLAKLMAPFTPFLAEELYQNLVRSVSPESPESVHLTDFPVADKSKIDESLAEANRLAMKVCSLGRAARSRAGIKVRQPLAHAVIAVTTQGQQESIERLKSAILDELNVKDLVFMSSASEVLRMQEQGYVLATLEPPSAGASGLHGVEIVAIPTTVSAELEAEGMAREIVHRIQGMRRSAGFEIADHIETYYQGDDYIRGVMGNKALAGYIAQETLSQQLAEGLPDDADFTESFKLGGHLALLGVKKLR